MLTKGEEKRARPDSKKPLKGRTTKEVTHPLLAITPPLAKKGLDPVEEEEGTDQRHAMSWVGGGETQQTDGSSPRQDPSLGRRAMRQWAGGRNTPHSTPPPHRPTKNPKTPPPNTQPNPRDWRVLATEKGPQGDQNTRPMSWPSKCG